MLSEILSIAGTATIVVGVLLLFFARKRVSQASRLLAQASDKWKNVKRNIENERREALVKLKDETYKRRTEFELEIKRERLEIERYQNKINSKYEALEKKEQRLDELSQELQQRERQISRTSDKLRVNEQKIKTLYNDLIAKLENLSTMTREEARKELTGTLEAEVRLASEKWIKKVEEDSRQTAKEKATQIVVTSMQRYIADQVAPHTSGIVHLPNEEMKGRIIGKEGRNIKALEMATGMEFIIGETPEVITISGFNPIRREVARRSLESLISDGRINPTRIEETVRQCEQDID